MNKITSRFSLFVVNKPKTIVGLILIITLFFSFFIPSLQVNPDVFENLPKDDKTAILFNKIGEDYGGNYICVIGIQCENVFSYETLSHIKQITDSAAAIQGIGSVSSLTNIIDIRGSEWGIEVGQLVDPYDIPKDQQVLDSLSKYVLNKKLYKGGLVSDDATMSIVMARIENGVDKIQVANELKRKIQSIGLKETLFFGGQAFIISEFGKVIIKDIAIIGPICLILILILLYFGLRTTPGVLLPLSTVIISILWTFGVMSICGVQISIITSIIPILLVAIGSAYSLHVINRIYSSEGETNEVVIGNGLRYIMVPVFLAAVTTIFGFLSFVLGSYLDLISKFGLFTALGIAISFFISISFVPAMMVLLGKRKNQKKNVSNQKDEHLSKWLKSVGHFVVKFPKRILISWLIILLVFIVGIFKIDRSVDFLEYFRKNNPNRIAENILQEKIGGTSPVYISVKGDILTPEVLKIIQKTENKLLSFPEIIHTQSVAGLIEEMNYVMGEGREIPADVGKIHNLWFLLDGQEILDRMINFEQNEAIINATYGSNDMETIHAFIASMNTFFEENRKEEISFELSGMPSLLMRFDKSIMKSQFQSLAIALLLVLIAVSLFGKSLKNGLLALTPILATLCILYGFMGVSGIPLDLATVLVGSISIGIGIDYSIHMINQISHEIKSGKSINESIINTIGISGKSISINVLSVSLGFLVLVLSNLVPLQRFGILVAVTMIGSGLGSISLLPAIYILINKKKESHEEN